MHLVSRLHWIEHGETVPRGEAGIDEAAGNSIVAFSAIGYST
jgi:hypothetical protein